MRSLARPILLLLVTLTAPAPSNLQAQKTEWLFPDRSLMPILLAGPRDPVTSAAILAVPRNPNAYGPGSEAELSIGTTLPILLLGGSPSEKPVILGLEAVAFARFGLQVLQREMVATDWIFALPLVWHHAKGWTRFRFYHTSSHMGDEYARRFGEPGVNFSRDALEVLTFRRAGDAFGAWAGVRYGYNVKPEDDMRWVLRTGAQLEARPDGSFFQTFLALDAEMDQEAAMRPRVEARVGTWLPEVAGRRAIRLSLVVLNGPTPLGQFGFRPTTQIGVSLQGSL